MKNLDSTLDYMENARFNYLYAPILSRLKKETDFSNTELVCIVMIYHKFVLANGVHAKYMSWLQLSTLFDVLFQIKHREINQRIVAYVAHKFRPTYEASFSPERHIHVMAFVKVFNIFFSNDLELRMKFVFSIYDGLERGFLDLKEITNFIEYFFTDLDEDELFEMRSDVTEMIFMKFDKDKDFVISDEEYYDVVRKQPMLMEFLGQVFPSTRDMSAIAICANVLSWFDKRGNAVKYKN